MKTQAPFSFIAQMTPALDSVLKERERQEIKWGEQNHDPFTYLTVLMEEVGELAEAALHLRFGGPAASGLRNEAVQVSAVALAIIECLDRAEWKWPVTPACAVHLRVREVSRKGDHPHPDIVTMNCLDCGATFEKAAADIR
jgi:NTP pyrophosphatase (non-canonical NTP hydrolase)